MSTVTGCDSSTGDVSCHDLACPGQAKTTPGGASIGNGRNAPKPGMKVESIQRTRLAASASTPSPPRHAAQNTGPLPPRIVDPETMSWLDTTSIPAPGSAGFFGELPVTTQSN